MSLRKIHDKFITRISLNYINKIALKIYKKQTLLIISAANKLKIP